MQLQSGGQGTQHLSMTHSLESTALTRPVDMLQRKHIAVQTQTAVCIHGTKAIHVCTCMACATHLVLPAALKRSL